MEKLNKETILELLIECSDQKDQFHKNKVVDSVTFSYDALLHAAQTIARYSDSLTPPTEEKHH